MDSIYISRTQGEAVRVKQFLISNLSNQSNHVLTWSKYVKVLCWNVSCVCFLLLDTHLYC